METLLRGIYENQTVRLDAPLPVREGATVEVILTLPEAEALSHRRRFIWEDGPVLAGDGTSRLTEELRRQRDGE